MVERFDSLFDCALRARALGGTTFALAEFRIGTAGTTTTTAETPDVARFPTDDLDFLQRESRVFHLLPAPPGSSGGAATEVVYLLGRSRERDVRMTDASVSARHASLILRPGAFELLVVDHGSRNGTFVDGHRAAPELRVAVHGGLIVRFGHVSTLVLDTAALGRLGRGT